MGLGGIIITLFKEKCITLVPYELKNMNDFRDE